MILLYYPYICIEYYHITILPLQQITQKIHTWCRRAATRERFVFAVGKRYKKCLCVADVKFYLKKVIQKSMKWECNRRHKDICKILGKMTWQQAECIQILDETYIALKVEVCVPLPLPYSPLFLTFPLLLLSSSLFMEIVPSSQINISAGTKRTRAAQGCREIRRG